MKCLVAWRCRMRRLQASDHASVARKISYAYKFSVMGNGGVVAVLIMVFMAVTSAM